MALGLPLSGCPCDDAQALVQEEHRSVPKPVISSPDHEFADTPPAFDWRSAFQAAQASCTVNVVCMKWGDRYPALFVNRLHGMVMRNTTWKVRFVCFTDDASGINSGIECQPLPRIEYDPKLGKYWPKLGLMQNDLGGLSGMTLFLDLDLVILDNIDALFTLPGRFVIIREWKDPQLGYGNSSVLRFFIGAESYILQRFHATAPSIITGIYDSKEQNFLTKAAVDVTFWPPEWVPPFSLACLPANRIVRFFSKPTMPTGAKVLVFYGSITPSSALLGQHEPKKRVGTALAFRPTLRRFRPGTWIADYWTE